MAEILTSVSLLEVRNYAALVNKCRVVEDCSKRLASEKFKAYKRNQKLQGMQPQQPLQKKPFQGGGYKGKQPRQSVANPQQSATNLPKSTEGQAYTKCRKFHKGTYLAGQNLSFQYGKPRYFVKDYTTTSQLPASKPRH